MTADRAADLALLNAFAIVASVPADKVKIGEWETAKLRRVLELARAGLDAPPREPTPVAADAPGDVAGLIAQWQSMSLPANLPEDIYWWASQATAALAAMQQARVKDAQAMDALIEGARKDAAALAAMCAKVIRATDKLRLTADRADELYECAEQAERERDEARLECDSYKTSQVVEDAERYRWLRQELMRVDPLASVVWKHNDDRNSSEWANIGVVEHLDAAIDAARGKG